ncbi:Germin-like protein 3-1 [Capsicum annuum]|uniref:Germin-like protein n=1 Tax=Capsicum annuum TaxID=4072 RepID=A0A2G2YE21_CAPAN|nr:germin-like protein subfamily 1 member 1 [Capsicum annuum]KAF3675980.1 Germin-like protein 3-1 [Capsicum annuum]PHT68003.1 Germin-like protein 3-1 [Capsicum annuum]
MGTSTVVLSLSVLFVVLGLVGSDPDPLQDYCVADTKKGTKENFYCNGVTCINPEIVNTSHFVTSALSKPGKIGIVLGFNVTLATIFNLPGMNTQGLTMARIDIGPNNLVPPHSHPRASEVAILLKGSLLVGFINTSNHLFTQNLKSGDCFVFPRGMIHFLYNTDSKVQALAVSGLSSQNPGVQMASLAAFATGLAMPDKVFKKLFQINHQDVTGIRTSLGG